MKLFSVFTFSVIFIFLFAHISYAQNFVSKEGNLKQNNAAFCEGLKYMADLNDRDYKNCNGENWSENPKAYCSVYPYFNTCKEVGMAPVTEGPTAICERIEDTLNVSDVLSNVSFCFEGGNIADNDKELCLKEAWNKYRYKLCQKNPSYKFCSQSDIAIEVTENVSKKQCMQQPYCFELFINGKIKNNQLQICIEQNWEDYDNVLKQREEQIYPDNDSKRECSKAYLSRNQKGALSTRKDFISCIKKLPEYNDKPFFESKEVCERFTHDNLQSLIEETLKADNVDSFFDKELEKCNEDQKKTVSRASAKKDIQEQTPQTSPETDYCGYLSLNGKISSDHVELCRENDWDRVDRSFADTFLAIKRLKPVDSLYQCNQLYFDESPGSTRRQYLDCVINLTNTLEDRSLFYLDQGTSCENFVEENYVSIDPSERLSITQKCKADRTAYYDRPQLKFCDPPFPSELRQECIEKNWANNKKSMCNAHPSLDLCTEENVDPGLKRFCGQVDDEKFRGQCIKDDWLKALMNLCENTTSLCKFLKWIP